ncbi:hypothetical protein EYF80_049970 [Liparis tanakae]|uniref:Uncharacterized protein n=1 Tax=Liparis tanakae TaxID=230148 RepID=A0A4Z2FF34_9TELE|nr:hypothetical protein EYF80_049970 [Liparis tanakae]
MSSLVRARAYLPSAVLKATPLSSRSSAGTACLLDSASSCRRCRSTKSSSVPQHGIDSSGRTAGGEKRTCRWATYGREGGGNEGESYVVGGDVLHQQHFQLLLGEPPAGAQRAAGERDVRAGGGRTTVLLVMSRGVRRSSTYIDAVSSEKRPLARSRSCSPSSNLTPLSTPAPFSRSSPCGGEDPTLPVLGDDAASSQLTPTE